MKRYVSFFLLNVLFILLAPGTMFGANYTPEVVFPVLPPYRQYVLIHPPFIRNAGKEGMSVSDFKAFVKDASEGGARTIEKSTGVKIKVDYHFYQEQNSTNPAPNGVAATAISRLVNGNAVFVVQLFIVSYNDEDNEWYLTSTAYGAKPIKNP